MTAQIALLVAPYVLAIVVPILVAVAGYFYRKAVSNLPADKRALLDQVARTVVVNVEQTASQQLNGPGKKQQALLDAARMLEHLGIKNVDSNVLGQFIEAAVYSLNQTKGAATVTATTLPMSSPSPANGLLNG